MFQCIDTCHCFDNKCCCHVAEKMNTDNFYGSKQNVWAQWLTQQEDLPAVSRIKTAFIHWDLLTLT